MRVLIDANVLVPSVMRGMVLGAAAAGAFAPLWSARILEEWARAARRLREGAEPAARAEIAALRHRWPEAQVAPAPELEVGLALPDAADRHVLAAAIAGGADILLTCNRDDFPGRTLARHGILVRDPDGFLREIQDERGLSAVAEALRGAAEAACGRPQALRPLLRRAGLPRLAKALAAEIDAAAAPGTPP